MNRFFSAIPLIICCTAYAQNSADKKYAHELEFIFDNDYIFFEDYYYTAGQDVAYRKLIAPNSRAQRFWGGRAPDSAKVIATFKTGFKIFNPRDMFAVKVDEMDRPYAGFVYGSAGITNFTSSTRGNYFGAELGYVGKNSGMEQLQLWWHKVTKYDPPKGWSQQIRNEWLVNLYYWRFQSWSLADDAELVSQSSFQVGTGGNRVSQDVSLRLFQFNPINNSAFTQSRLSWGPGKNEREEIFVFLGFGLDYVLTNVFIEGSINKDHKSPFVVPVEPWVLRRNIGIMYSNRPVSLTAVFCHLSKEVRDGNDHNYLNLRLAVRF